MLSDWKKKFTRRVFSTIPMNPGGWNLENPKLRNKDHPNRYSTRSGLKALNGQGSKLSNLSEGCQGEWCSGLRGLKGIEGLQRSN